MCFYVSNYLFFKMIQPGRALAIRVGPLATGAPNRSAVFRSVNTSCWGIEIPKKTMNIKHFIKKV